MNETPQQIHVAFIDATKPVREPLNGRKFGRLTVESFSHWHNRKFAYWKCKCSCGSISTVRGYDLIRGKSKSCGCFSAELSRDRFTVHGATSGYKLTREYVSWCHMRDRCKNPNTASYKHYGGRGIKVCARWSIFSNFLSDMGRCPSGFTIERKNNNRNYEPGNCIWANRLTQANNTRKNHFLTVMGRTLTISQWASQLGLKTGTLHCRISAGWPVEKAVSIPVKRGQKISHTWKP